MARAKDTDLGRLLTRRAFVIGGVQASLFAVLFGRLYSLQVAEGERYSMQAEANRISTRLILPQRGLIVDRNGTFLARSQKNFRADLVPEQAPDIKETLRRLFATLNFDEAEKTRILKDLKRGKTRLPVLLRDNLDWETLSLLELRTPDLPGVVIEAGEVRNYPFASTTAHILGYVGPPTEEEAGDDPLLNQPGFRLGKNGLERSYDEDLQGEAGSMELEVNAYGQPVRELTRRPSNVGHELKLTLDITLQHYTQERLAGETSASAVVMDAVDGSIYALVSHPSFDPNAFSYGISRDMWAKLNGDPLTPLNNKAVQGAYAPGSTFKLVTAMAALEAGIPSSTHAFCPGHLDLGNHRFHCWKKGGHGTVDMKRGIAQSCDVFFYHLGQKVGIDAIHDMAARLGLGAKLDVDLPHEKAGLMPSRVWKVKQFKEAWQPGETLVAAIGQGYTVATPLQLAVMTSRLINGGKAVKPHFMQSVEGVRRAPQNFPSLQFNEGNLAFMRSAMLGVCQPGGTAVASQTGVAGYEMGGKTGTSQVRRIGKAERAKGVIANEKKPWEERDHALFVGFAPANNPRYVVSVVVEHGGGGSHTAAPIARDLLLKVGTLDPAKILPMPISMPTPKTETPAVTPAPQDATPLEDEDMPLEDEVLDQGPAD